MLKRPLILFCLLFAYAIMMAHAVIPHHHHNTLQEADFHHQNEFLSNLHTDENSDAKGHTMHFVHSPDFDTYITPSTFKFRSHSPFQLEIVPFSPAIFNLHVLALINETLLLPEFSPPDKVYSPLPNGLRGSPASYSLC